MLAARREGTATVRSDGEVEGSGSRRLRAEGSDRRSRLCAGGQWQGGRGSGDSSNGCSRGGGLMGATTTTIEAETRVRVDGCVVAMRAASGGGGLRGCAEEQRVMAAGASAGCSRRGEKEAEEATIAAKVSGKRRKQQPTMGGSGGCRPKLAAAAVKKVSGWLRLRLRGRGWAALEGEETTALDPAVGSGGGGDAGEGRHD
ncbi:hypothetical protein B296_00028641 [Ensete ventricosum]|uniref:Uncharacterized protein n=1 Tax=Ensete ventricosum TaxID=4639 RepID=A0A426YY19_ENSVE|nr:hypothetical protein B296_00028641 [Ensete ventricosum]